MQPMELTKKNPLSSFYGGKLPKVAGKPASTRGKNTKNSGGKPHSKANPGIMLINPTDKEEEPVCVKQHPHPPRRVAANIAATGRAAGRVASSSTIPVVSDIFVVVIFFGGSKCGELMQWCKQIS